jgi:hypothetical protein
MKINLYILFISIIITSCNEFPDLGNGYKFSVDGKNSLQIINSESTVMISAHVLDFSFDSTFIIVLQRPWDSIPEIRTMNYRESNIALKESDICQYWIINKQEKSIYVYDSLNKKVTYSNVYGPFMKESYKNKKKELGVPDNLRLKNE